MSSAPASQPATPNPEKESELIYGLESHPPFGSSLLAALQHILAMVLSVMAPPAIVAGALGVPPEAIAYLVSMSLLFAGIGIWFQVSRPFGIGSGMLSIQATSFAFPGTLIAVGALLMKEQGMSWEQALSTLFGVCFIGGFVVMAGSRIMPFLRKIITPTVAGITVMMIGVSPVPFKFGFFGFDLHSFLVLSFLFLVVVIEAIGDLTATSVVSEQPVRGRVYRSRLAGGILCDGMMTSLGAIFGCFPVATFSQNNGVIQLSGVASRKVGKFCGVLFILFALFPIIVVFFQLLPRPVLGGALVVLFGTIACSGIRILLQHEVNRRESIIIAVSIGVGLMSMTTPEVFERLPRFLKIFFDSAIVSGGVTAMIVHQILPKGICPYEGDEDDEDCNPHSEFLFNKHE